MIIELDGLAAALDTQADEIGVICRAHHCGELRVARDEEERRPSGKGANTHSARPAGCRGTSISRTWWFPATV